MINRRFFLTISRSQGSLIRGEGRRSAGQWTAALAATEVKTSIVTSSSSSGLNEAKAVAGLPTKVVHENGREKAQEQQQQTSRNNNFNRQNAAIKQRQQKQQQQQQLQYRNAKIPLIPRALHEYLFGQGSADSQMLAQMTEEADCAESRLQLPPLRAEGNLSEHFRLLGQEQFRDYEELLAEAMAIRELPPMPDQWHVGAGWTAYDGSAASSVRFPEEKLLFFDVEICMQDGKLPTMAVALSPTRWYSWCSQRLVDEQMELPDFIRPDHLIPLEDSDANGNGGRRESQLVIGHNVAFDRQFIREQYLQRESAMRFWCTMSMHIACAGMADHQRNLYEKSKLNGRDFQMANIVEEEGLEGKYKFTPEFQQFVDRWKERTCRNSLQAVLSKYCAADGAEDEEQHPPPMALEKKWQEFFVKQDIQTIRQHSQELLAYCAADVRATFQVFQRIYPIFRNRFPHPITYCGMMEMANAYLPITGNWHRFFHKCEAVSSVSKNEASHQLIRSTQELIKELDQQVDEKQAVKKYALDPWLWVSDWNRPPKHPQWPVWYFGIFQTRAAALASLEELDAKSVKLLCRQIPRIFGLCFGPYPLLFVPKFGWGFLVPSAEERDFETLPQLEEVALGDEKLQMPVRVIYEMIRRNQIIKNDVITRSSTPATSVGIFDFYRLPHPSGKPKMNVGSPFVKGNKLNFENFEEGVIFPTRFAEVLQCFLQSRSTTRFWGNYRDRFQEQLPVWLDEQAELGAIVPSVIPAGTVTRRAVHKLWLTSANPKKEIIGSDLKSMIQCTDGWFLVGADVDSQEQWIAALFGDSLHESRRAGATPFSNMLLTGNKSDRTDLHSVVAKQVGITRDQAKVLNYARLYGSGKLHAEQFLKTQGISSTVAKELTNKLFEATKGKAKNYAQLTREGASLFKEFLTAQSKNSYQNKSPINGGYLIIDGAYFLETQHPNYHNNNLLIARFDEWLTTTRKSANSKLLFASRPLVKLYKDGYESHTFNFLSLKSNELHPRTPILKCQLSEALEPFQVYDKNKQIIKTHEMFNKMYKRTIINWFVQSSAVDFLHMLLVCMRWLCTHYDIRARFVISIHDELRYLVPEEDKYRCAQALTLSNMFVRAAISEALGIQELPRSIAFFSQVDIDTVLRKEVNIECRTPDGKLVRQGESLNIDEILEKTGGSLNKTTPR